MTWRWPWSRKRTPEPDTQEAEKARQSAGRRLREAQRRWPEVRRAGDVLASEVEDALRRTS